MLKNYLTIAIRHLVRHKVYSLINIVGLAIGMACCLLILLYVQHELSYDRFHDKADRIYRILPTVTNQDGTMIRQAVTPAGMAPRLLEEFPEVIAAVRIWNHWAPLLKHNSKHLMGHDVVFADSSFLTMFSFRLLKGNPRTALRDPLSLVLTESTAKILFGNEDPLGEIISFDNRSDFTVTGVVQDVPPTSNLHFSYVASFVSLKDVLGQKDALEDYTNWNYYTYLLLPEHYPPSELEKKFPEFMKKHLGEEAARNSRLSLQPITAIHLDPAVQFDGNVAPKGDRRVISTFSVIAFFIVVIACINFVNLSTARSATRAKEVGIRKVVGAHRFQLLTQFVGESILLSFLALLLAVALAEVVLPLFSDLSGRRVVLDYGNRLTLLFGFLGVGLFVGIVAGSYPAVYLSAFQPVAVLKGTSMGGTKGTFLRRVLVVVQFMIAIVLMIGTVIVWEQFRFMKSQDLGFDKEHVIFMYGTDLLKLKPELLQNPHILRVGGAHSVPGHVETKRGYFWQSKEGERSGSFYTIVVDPDYLETLGLVLVAGRNFSWEVASDGKEAYVLNETAIRELGWDPVSAVGKEFRVWDRGKGRVIGVVKDSHFESLRHKIEPLVLHMDPSWLSRTVIKISSKDTPGTVAFLKQKWEKLSSDRPFAYEFLDIDFDRLYRADEKQGQILAYSSLLAIVIACLGLFGLASFAAEQRTKEIGVRKTLGASVTSIVLLLSKEFTKLVLVANVIAWPIAYCAMNRWLQGFAYRIDIGWGTFVVGGALALVIALVTVTVQAVKAALANPVEALRYE